MLVACLRCLPFFLRTQCSPVLRTPLGTVRLGLWYYKCLWQAILKISIIRWNKGLSSSPRRRTVFPKWSWDPSYELATLGYTSDLFKSHAVIKNDPDKIQTLIAWVHAHPFINGIPNLVLLSPVLAKNLHLLPVYWGSPAMIFIPWREKQNTKKQTTIIFSTLLYKFLSSHNIKTPELTVLRGLHTHHNLEIPQKGTHTSDLLSSFPISLHPDEHTHRPVIIMPIILFTTQNSITMDKISERSSSFAQHVRYSVSNTNKHTHSHTLTQIYTQVHNDPSMIQLSIHTHQHKRVCEYRKAHCTW